MHWNKNTTGVILQLILFAAAAAGNLFFPGEATAWGKATHLKIAEMAIDALPAAYRGEIIPYKDDILQAVIDQEQGKKAETGNFNSQLLGDIQLLTLVPHKQADLTHYYAYRLGEIGCSVADLALPYSCVNPSDSAVKTRLENDVDSDVSSFYVNNISPTCLTYPSIYLERMSKDARKSENFVRTRYLAGRGYPTCKEDFILPSFRCAVEAVASIWMTVLSKNSAPAAISPPIRVIYYTNQIRFSSERNHLEDVYAGLQKLKQEGTRVPLTPSFVGDKFFNLSFSEKTRSIYDLAKLVDPQSARVSERKRACDEYLERNPEVKKTESPKKRRIPRHLFGLNGNPPDIYVYQHSSGLLLLTSKVKDVGPDYVLLNFEPVKKLTKKKIVKKVKNEPETVEFDLEEIIDSYAEEYGVSAALVKAVIRAESNFDPFAVSSCGARGLMQLMPSTALEMQVEDIFDPEGNVGGGVQYLARMLELFNGDLKLALAAYNAGPGNVLRYGGVPPFKETKRYVPKVLSYYEQYKDDPTPVRLKVALNKKPAADFLPEVEVVEEVEVETVMTSPPLPKPSPEHKVIVTLKNGNTMRGKAYEKTPSGIKLIVENGSIHIRQELITNIS